MTTNFFTKAAGIISSLVAFVGMASFAQRPVDYVNPTIGTGFHGHVFVGANVPFGAVQLGPVNISEGWDWCSGYHVSDSTIVGFSHTHLSGTGIGDLGDILIMPATGTVYTNKGTAAKPGYLSFFSHNDETVKAGYYSVKLKKNNIKAELTATTRVGFHQYTFPASESSHFVVDLVEGIGWDRPMEGYISKLNDSTLVGYRFSKGWANDQRIYFAMVFSKPFKQLSLYTNNAPQVGDVANGDTVKAVVHFPTTKDEVIQVKVAISPVSTENAMLNMEAELPGWNFAKTVEAARDAWDKELSKVTIKTNDEKRKQVFYTALYHTMIAPSIFNDVNGDYYGTDKQVHHGAKFTNLTTFSLWDTYRGANPLFTVLQPERVSDMVNSMLAIYKQQGRLPVWHLMGNETNCMPGNSSIQVIADACLKNINGIDQDLAYEAMKATTMLDLRGLKYVKQFGFIPADSMVESVAMGMEYSISDASIALMAKKRNSANDYAYFGKRGEAYKFYYDPKVGFARGRISKDEWREPYSPFVARHGKDDFTEGNGWQYTWLVPQDVEGLMALMGGDKKFAAKLDSLFTAKGDMGAEASDDISGLIGQYAHGNEPSHHITYMYAFAGQPWKTADKVRYILDSLYSDRPDGLSGNEDVGQMSAWYVWSALGMYPVHPAGGLYVFGSPVFDDAVINLPGQKTFHIKVNNNSASNKYIQKLTLNGKPYPKSYILHSDIMNAGELVIDMGSKPSKTFGVKQADRPYSPKY